MQEMIELAKRRNDESGLGTLSWLTTAAAIVILYYYWEADKTNGFVGKQKLLKVLTNNYVLLQS